MKKTIIALVLCMLMCLSCASAIDFSELPFDTGNITTGWIERQETAHQMAECARALGLPEECETIQTAKEIWNESQTQIMLIKQRQAVWEARFQRYPAATYIWIFLTEQCGYNDYVAAGILGNIMAEVGGQTLNIQYWIGGRGYYGMCQWNRRYFPGVQEQGLAGQCQFLANTMNQQFGSGLSNFLALQDYNTVALSFARNYERCSSASYNVRQRNAAKAYAFFTS